MIATFIAVVFACLSAGLAALFLQTRRQTAAAHETVQSIGAESTSVRRAADAAVARARQLEQESWAKSEQIEELREESRQLQLELDKRPKLDRKVYRIVTLGISGTGKTSLTLKWANPLVQLQNLRGTKFEKYERTVSITHVKESHVAIQHVFEVNDWGGEHIADAQAQLVREESIHGMLFVVDLALDPNAREVDLERVRLQLREFERPALRFLFSAAVTKHCKTVVLFINKSDVIPGTPAQIAQKACEHYRPLIDDLTALQEEGRMDLTVLVGSANHGHNVHHLYAHFVANILPENAYDDQLLQRMKGDEQAVPVQTLPTNGVGTRGYTPRPTRFQPMG